MDFDRFTTTYDEEVAAATRFAGLPTDFYRRVKAQHLLTALRGSFDDLSSLRVLDVGCGIGLMDRLLADDLPGLEGVDVSEKSVTAARARNPGLRYHHAAGERLPFPDGSFDVVFAICVWHHVPPEFWPAFAADLFRVVAPSGRIFIYEHNPWNPLTRLVVSRCSFDADAVLLSSRQAQHFLRTAGFRTFSTDYLFFLPLDRPLIQAGEGAFLRKLPIGAQYALSALRA